jgi:diguanylate cyclase (GGDEF)-like protein
MKLAVVATASVYLRGLPILLVHLLLASNASHYAQHDFLAELPNRILLNNRVRRAIVAAQRHSQRAAGLFLDLDGFKDTNDSLGHSIGDKLLKPIANRLEVIQ